MSRVSEQQREQNKLCRIPGCTRPWTTTFSPHGPVCGLHAPSAPPPAPKVPTTPPAKAWSDPERDDE